MLKHVRTLCDVKTTNHSQIPVKLLHLKMYIRLKDVCNILLVAEAVAVHHMVAVVVDRIAVAAVVEVAGHTADVVVVVAVDHTGHTVTTLLAVAVVAVAVVTAAVAGSSQADSSFVHLPD